MIRQHKDPNAAMFVAAGRTFPHAMLNTVESAILTKLALLRSLPLWLARVEASVMVACRRLL